MARLPYDNGFNDSMLSDGSLDRWLERQEDGLHELPEEHEFKALAKESKSKPLSRVRQKLRSVISKRRRYAYQAT